MDSMKIFGDYLCRTETITDVVNIVKSCINTKNQRLFLLKENGAREKRGWLNK